MSKSLVFSLAWTPLTLLYAVIIAAGFAFLIANIKGSRYISLRARSVTILLTAMRSCSWSLQTKCLGVVIMSFSWTPLQYSPARIPERKGSSENDSNPRPPIGALWMLMVGPRRICTPLALASSPSNRPTDRSKSLSKVAPKAVEQGRQAAGTPLKIEVPRIPFGPSDVRRAGILSRGMGTVCQKSEPMSTQHAYHEILDKITSRERAFFSQC